MTAAELITELQQYADPKAAQSEARFFKAYDGGYGEGDMFLGLKVPLIRKVAMHFKLLGLAEIEKLLDSPLHEHRQAALMIMVAQTKRASAEHRKALYDLFLRRADAVNNWDLVDGSAPDIVGGFLYDKPREILYRLARSTNVWERRIAIVATYYFIRHKELDDTFMIATILLQDRHDLMHKATGWMLRETGKRDQAALSRFLDRYAHEMPRTMLRYAIEHYSPEERQQYMRARVAKSFAK